MYITYTPKKFSATSLAVIDLANVIIDNYFAEGFKLTLRQLYYQFVSKDVIENTERSYKRLGSIINDARLAGLVSWEAIEDRTRWLRSNSHFNDPADVIEAAKNSYLIDMWENQPKRVEVWIEKDALVGVIEGICGRLDIPYFACRGYVSQSEMWSAAQRIKENYYGNQETVILHLGDHDPSGIDMTRDIEDRLNVFGQSSNVSVERIALNMDQIEELKPPPNPAKLSDARADRYISVYGRSSWELDALEPKYIVELLRRHISKHTDPNAMAESVERLNNDTDVLDDMIERCRGE